MVRPLLSFAVMAVHATRLFLFAALGAIALVCLPPSGPQLSREIDLCLLCGQNGGASALLNIVLYLPLGAALWWRWRRLGRVVLAGAAVSLTVEILQLGIPGRHTALSDLVANSLGALTGALLAVRPSAWLLPTGRVRRALAVGSTVAACALMAVAGVLFAPSAPAGTYYGQWEPGSGFGRSYDGRVLDARVGDLPLPGTTLPDADAVRRSILARDPVEVRFVAGTPMRPLTAVFRLVAGPYDASTEVLQVGLDGEALVLTPRFRADDARASRPEVQLERGLAGVARGDTVTVRLRSRAGRGYEVRVDGGAPETVGFSVGRSWSLFYATSWRSAARLRAMDLAWLGGMALAVGWFASGAGGSAVALAALLATASLTPALSDLLPTRPLEYAAILVGLLLGRWARAAGDRLAARTGGRGAGAR